MVDTNPMDPTSHTTQPRYWDEVIDPSDFEPSPDEVINAVFERDPDRTQPLQVPAAPLSAEKMAARDTALLILKRVEAVADDDDFRSMALDIMGIVERAIAKAVEALTAENATLSEKAAYWRGQHAAVAAELREERMQHLVDLGQAMQPELYAGAKGVTNSVITSPLADPEYPALMAEALRQARDGD